MPFRDPVSFLVLPPGATPPTVGQSIILLDPGPPPTMKFYTGDADETAPGELHAIVEGDGSLHLEAFSPTHSGGTSQKAELHVMSGTDALPDDTMIRGNSASMSFVAAAGHFFSIRPTEPKFLFSGDVDSQFDGRILEWSAKPVTARMSTDVDTANSGNITTTEVAVQQPPTFLTSNGRTYKVVTHIPVASTVAADTFTARIREGAGVTGNILQEQVYTATVANRRYMVDLEAEWTAAASALKAFSVTLIRTSGTGNITMQAAATRPAYSYVDYVRN